MKKTGTVIAVLVIFSLLFTFGSFAQMGQMPAIIAAEIKKGNEVLKLRDEKGFPVWSGHR